MKIFSKQAKVIGRFHITRTHLTQKPRNKEDRITIFGSPSFIMSISPYLTFNGQAKAALAFYQSKLGMEVSMCQTYRDSPEPMPGGDEHPEYILHAEGVLLGSYLMICDSAIGEDTSKKGISLSINLDKGKEESAKSIYDALAENGEVIMPLEKAFWAPLFGMVEDQFGVVWQVMVNPE